MTAWLPSETRRRHSLAISAAEKASFDARMAPLSRDAAGLFDADAVFEGGGALGIAFLGAARCCHDLGLRWHGLAGASAGAISAALLAANLPIDALEYELSRVDFRDFLQTKTSKLTFNGEPGDDLAHPVVMLTNLALVGELGQYSTAPFAQWMEELLYKAGIPTFGDVWAGDAPADRQLKVIVSDLSRGEMAVLPDDLELLPQENKPYRITLTPKQRAYRVSEAVRLSMSIPFFFEPGTLERPGGKSTIVDGGVLSNFPLWLYDHDVPGQPPTWPTFGFRLIDKSAKHPESVAGLMAAMLNAKMLASDRRYLSPRHLGRTVEVDLTGLNISATSFNLSNDQKDALYVRGYQSAKRFFVEDWNWARHVKLRGN